MFEHLHYTDTDAIDTNILILEEVENYSHVKQEDLFMYVERI